MQRHRHEQGVGLQKGRGGTREPFRRRADDIMSVTMLERKHKASTVLVIEQRRAPARPGPGID